MTDNLEHLEAELQEKRKLLEIQKATTRWLKVVVVCNIIIIAIAVARILRALLK